MSYCELFFVKHLFFFKTTLKLFFYALTKKCREEKLKKVAFHSSLSPFPLSAVHEAIGGAVLPNIFFQSSSTSSRKLLASMVKLSSVKRGLSRLVLM